VNGFAAGEAGSPEDVYRRAEAAFLGVAVGDALGATTEFMTPGEIRVRYNVHRKIIGGGLLNLKRGQVTDDTQMSFCIARALCITGYWDLREIAEQFVAWLKSPPVDVGTTCRRGIRNYMMTGDLAVSHDPWGAGNGAVMRMAPVALFTLGSTAELTRCATEQAHLTHNNPLSDAACIAVGRMIHEALIRGEGAPLRTIARELVAAYPPFEFANYRGAHTGYVVDTMTTVFHFLFTTASFEDCLVGVVNQGGDADTNGAIAGMIAGAFYGLNAIPRHWLRRLDPEAREAAREYAARLIRLSPWMASAADTTSKGNYLA